MLVLIVFVSMVLFTHLVDMELLMVHCLEEQLMYTNK